MRPEDGARDAPATRADPVPRIEQLLGELDHNDKPPGSVAPAAAERADAVAFEVLAEAAGVAVNCAEELEAAATSGDRARARLWACLLSRAARSALLTVADLFAEPRRVA
jgi:hypothetical protein